MNPHVSQLRFLSFLFLSFCFLFLLLHFIYYLWHVHECVRVCPSCYSICVARDAEESILSFHHMGFRA